MRVILLLLTFLTLAPHAIAAQSFATLPILHEGRMQPIVSFARSMKSRIYGDRRHAVPWLLNILFNPANAERTPLIRVKNKEVIKLLALQPHQDKLYSFQQVSSALKNKRDILHGIANMPEEDWTQPQKALLRLSNNVQLMRELLASLSLFLPIDVRFDADAPEEIKPLIGKTLSYKQVLPYQQDIFPLALQITRDKGNQLDNLTAFEDSIITLSFAISQLAAASQDTGLFRVIPVQDDLPTSPWQADHANDAMAHWQALALAYHAQNKNSWKNAIHAIHNGHTGLRQTALQAEYYYHTFQPMLLSAIGYGAALLLLIASLRFAALKPLMLPLFSLGIITHVIGIAARIYILQRPPVSTLYESILFVGVTVALFGLIWAWRRPTHITRAISIGGLGGLFLHVVAFSHYTDGDSMMMLSAVLNSNFWLAIHVLCIMLGYAACLITSGLAHHALWRNQYNIRLLRTAALISLVLTASGTILGGIWADQSWGRFWGWDPKENGALLIVLWLIWALHGRFSGQLTPKAESVLYAYASVIVALSWFGVNLLSIGLHAYGFTDSALYGLIGFITLETLLIGALTLKPIQK